jgi:hypothetical protein
MTLGYTPRVIVKFKDNLVDRKVKNAADQWLKGFIAGRNWTKLVAQKQFQKIKIEKMFKAVSQAQLLELVDKAKVAARKQQRTYNPPNFLTYFAIPCPTNVNPETLAHELSSRPWKNMVEFAYVASAPAPSPTVPHPDQNPRFAYHDTDYLKSAPAGIDAVFAWGFDGGDGGVSDLKWVDIESDWIFPHVDLPAGITEIQVGNRRPYWDGTMWSADHGLAVLGIVVAQDNSSLSLGVTPNIPQTNTMVAPVWRYSSSPAYEWHFEPEAAILAAIPRLGPGDVMLLEAQLDPEIGDPYHNTYVPVEYDEYVYRAIQLATSLNIVVVEAAGNWSHNLEDLGKPWLNRFDSNFDDSGAVMVSAASPWDNGGGGNIPPDWKHYPVFVTQGQRAHNYGNRIDCYAWADNIYTTRNTADGGGNFGSTSGAAAIIAGAALAIQGISQAFGKGTLPNKRLPAGVLRTYLADPGLGTPSQDPTHDLLGVMPDLRKILNLRLGLWVHPHHHGEIVDPRPFKKIMLARPKVPPHLPPGPKSSKAVSLKSGARPRKGGER